MVEFGAAFTAPQSSDRQERCPYGTEFRHEGPNHDRIDVCRSCRLPIAQAVIEPVVFALFVITITWPLEKALQARLPKAAALLLTIIITSVTVLTLFWMIAWGGHEVADWIGQNLDQAQAALLTSTAWLEEHDIFVLAFITENVNAASIIKFLHIVAVRRIQCCRFP